MSQGSKARTVKLSNAPGGHRQGGQSCTHRNCRQYYLLDVNMDKNNYRREVFQGGLILLFLFWSATSFAGHDHPEKWYQSQWCATRGQAEFVLPDKTRCDCLTPSHAVEFDFGEKWAEAIGQSLYYSLQTGKRAGVVLILEKEKDRRYWLRLNSTIMHFGLPIDTWAVGDGAM